MSCREKYLPKLFGHALAAESREHPHPALWCFPFFLVIVLISSITGRGAAVYLPTAPGEMLQSAPKTGKNSFVGTVRCEERGEGEERLGRDVPHCPGRGCWARPGSELTGGEEDALFQAGFTQNKVSSCSIWEGRIWSRLLPLSGARNSAASRRCRSSQAGAAPGRAELLGLMQTLNKCPLHRFNPSVPPDKSGGRTGQSQRLKKSEDWALLCSIWSGGLQKTILFFFKLCLPSFCSFLIVSIVFSKFIVARTWST